MNIIIVVLLQRHKESPQPLLEMYNQGLKKLVAVLGTTWQSWNQLDPQMRWPKEFAKMFQKFRVCLCSHEVGQGPIESAENYSSS